MSKGKLFPALLALLVWSGVAFPVRGGYWEWGYGAYGAGSTEDIARFDWSCVNFGNIPEDLSAVERCNRILEYNPEHKFLLRLWPITNKGDLPGFRHQMTMFDYFYKPGAKEAMFQHIEAQIRLIADNISNPEAIVAATFLEELPAHITSFSIMRTANDRIAIPDFEEMVPYEQEITAELGAKFDPKNVEHMKWWGKKFVTLMDETHGHIKKLLPDAKVIYWQATSYRTLDMVEHYECGVLPFTYGDILASGNCDGIFGYPNNAAIWKTETQDMVARYNCLFFSQVSTPAFMRLDQFDTTMATACWEHPNNLGTFFFVMEEMNPNSFNVMPESRRLGDLWGADWDYQYRYLGHRYNVGCEAVERILAPEVHIVYDWSGKKQSEFVPVVVYVRNAKDASWYGNDVAQAQITPELELILPEGVSWIPNSAPARVNLGIMQPGEIKVIDGWWLQLKEDADTQDIALKVILSGDGISRREFTAAGIASAPPPAQKHTLSRLSPRWVEWSAPAGGANGVSIAALIPEGVENPGVKVGKHEVTYRGVLLPGEVLRIDGDRATLVQDGLFDERVRNFGREPQAPPQPVASGYAFYSTPKHAFESGAEYRLTVDAACGEDTILQVNAEFYYRRDGEGKQETVTVIYDAFSAGTVSVPVTAPVCDPGTGELLLRFYRAKDQGVVTPERFSLQQEKPEVDVSARLQGKFPALNFPAVLEYDDDTPLVPPYYILATPRATVELF